MYQNINHGQYNSDMIGNMIMATIIGSSISVFSQNIPKIIEQIVIVLKKIFILVFSFSSAKNKTNN